MSPDRNLEQPDPMSRLALAQPAVRKKAPAKILLSAAEGGGKTETALWMARELAGPSGDILFFDTEGSGQASLLYADEHRFTHIPWEEPYPPRELAADIRAADRDGLVIIVDSIYSFWSGEGGTLDIADKNAPGNGNKNTFAGWAVARPAQNDLLRTITRARAHIILCCRAKPSYVLVPGANGKNEVQTLGTQPIQDDSLPGEVNLHLRLATDHEITVAKSRIRPIPQNTTYTGDRAREIARTYAEWCKGGEPLISDDVVDELMRLLNSIPEKGDLRLNAKRRFFNEIGRPRYLRESEADAALELATQLAAEAAEIVGSQPARPTAPTTATPAADAPDPDRFESWVEVSRNLPTLLGEDHLNALKAWVAKERAKDPAVGWKPTTGTALNKIIAAAREAYQAGHGGPRVWDDAELTAATVAVAKLRTDTREWTDFAGVAFENLADPDAPETWTDDQFDVLATWIRIDDSASPEGEPPDDRHEHPAAAA